MTHALRTPSPAAMRPLDARLLLADDDQVLRRSLQRVLKRNGITVSCVGSTGEAQALMATERFDLVLSDIHMPGGGGLALLESTRRTDPDLPVILLTGNPELTTAVAAVNRGALQYLLKPIEPTDLLRAVRRGVQLHRVATARRRLQELHAKVAEPTPELHDAFDRAMDGLWMAYQPIVRTDGTAAGFEALMRSVEPELPHPGAVLEAAETLERVEEVGRIVRQRAMAPLRMEERDELFFINLHPRELLDEQLYSPDGPMAGYARNVVLEITERCALGTVPDAAARIASLRQLGYRIALDDLGAGFAGLSSFAVLEPDVVKLDRSLVTDVDGCAVRQQLVGSMTQLCSDLGMLVVAEGIERVEEWETLRTLGCDLFQGYLFSRPAPWADQRRRGAFLP